MEFKTASIGPLSLTMLVLTSITTGISLNTEKFVRPCLKSLSVAIREEDVEQSFANGSLLHDGILYPPKYYWREENVTYGCPCEIAPNCVRKCCMSEQVLAGNLKLECVDVADNRTIPDIAPKHHQLAEDVRNISRFEDGFVLVKNNHRCPLGAYKLEPENFPEDQFVLQSNGTLSTGNKILPQWKYCIDVHEDLAGLKVLVCADPETPEHAVSGIIYPFGIAVSVPFLLATFFVYAIIPELKNLYGMTLMCYVGCLVVAYSFLACERFVYSGHPLCVVIVLSVILASLASWLASAETTTIKSLPTLIAEEIASYNSTEIWSNDFDDPEGNGTVRSFTVTNASLAYQDEVESEASDNSTIADKSVIMICCEPGLYYTGRGKCGKNETNPPEELIFPAIYDSSLRNSSKKPVDFLLRYRYPCIDGSYALNADEPSKEVFYLLENGTILQPHNREYPTIESDKYCLASMMRDNGTKHLVLACFPIEPPPEHKINIRFILYPVAMCLSTIFLIATIVVYSIVPELKTMHGITLRCYLACLMFSYIGLSIAQLIGGTSFIADKPNVCRSLGFTGGIISHIAS